MASIPYPIQVLVGLLAYRKATTSLNAQGTGLLTREQFTAHQAECWAALDAQVAAARQQSNAASRPDEPFWLLGGDQPTEADASLMAFVVTTLFCTAYVNPLKWFQYLIGFTRDA